MIDAARLDRALADLPTRFPGPGGAVAVVKDGEAVVHHTYGLADLERRIPWTTRTLSPICSITKEFTCALLLDQLGDPGILDPSLAARLPLLEEAPPRTIDLCNNQSGLRDYWALTVLCGAAADGEFRPADAKELIGRTRSLHFKPGTQYSYSNGNFRILAEMMEAHLGEPFGDMLTRRLLQPAGMQSAQFCAETSRMPGDAVGYEGDQALGFVPAVNRIHWSGDAGISASLDDMIAFETWIDASRNDPESLYSRISVQPHFANGTPAEYGLGLVHFKIDGVSANGHGGALRGWRSHRIHVPSERLSVVILFNHSADAREAALNVLAAARGVDFDTKPLRTFDASWQGDYLDPTSGLLLRLGPKVDGRLKAQFATGPETLDLNEDGSAVSPGMCLTRDGKGFAMVRPADNIRSNVVPLSSACEADIAGSYHSAELDSRFTCGSFGGAFFGGFEGFLGRGALEAMQPVGADVWTLACRRSMDAPAPGNWTVSFERQDGRITSVEIGCWLARCVRFKRLA